MATAVTNQARVQHGVLERGLSAPVHSRLYEGRFGRMFRTLPAAVFTDEDMAKLAAKMTAQPEPKMTPETEIDDEENFGIPAGYTYLGQFIDHDITFDPMSSLMKQNDPDGLVDFRTPALDLDCLYGRGPDDQPYMFEPSGRKFILGDRVLTGTGTSHKPNATLTRDLPRFHARALIGDKRNDENVIVSQLQGFFLRFHNYMADKYPDEPFTRIQQRVRWHYQWLVLFDFLPRIIGREMMEKLLPHLKPENRVPNGSINASIVTVKHQIKFFHWKETPFMPVEFSGAAYRFGHSMVRPVYRLSLENLPNSHAVEGLGGRKMIFDPIENDGLNGFREFPASWGIDWDLYFERPGHSLSPKELGPGRVQPSYKIDTSLVSPLGRLPEFSKAGSAEPKPGQISSLGLRNLKRGVALGLPSGQTVARFMGIEPIPDAELLVGKANVGGLAENGPITDCGKSFINNAPLWFYVLAEAQWQWKQKAKIRKKAEDKNTTPTRLGEVGGRIVGETLIGLILGDPNSFLSLDPTWEPEFGDPKVKSPYDRFMMGHLIEIVPPVS